MEESDELTNQLMNVFTIDGRGRPKKAQLFLELIKEYGPKEVIQKVEEIAQRKWF